VGGGWMWACEEAVWSVEAIFCLQSPGAGDFLWPDFVWVRNRAIFLETVLFSSFENSPIC
jgi:hypothetical protein